MARLGNDSSMDTVPGMNGDLYHASYGSRMESIFEDGLQPGPDGCVYLAGPRPAHAAQFIAMRPEVDGVHEVELDGQMLLLPKIVENDIIAIFTIDATMLNADLLQESGDHNSDFFHEDTASYCYFGSIDPDCIELTHEIDLEELANISDTEVGIDA